MSAPRLEWLTVSRAFSIISRETGHGGNNAELECALLAALRDGVVRSRRSRAVVISSGNGGTIFSEPTDGSNKYEYPVEYWRNRNLWSWCDEEPEGCVDTLEIHQPSLRRWLDPGEPAVAKEEKRGRPVEKDWEGALIELIAIADIDGLYEAKPAEIANIMREWFKANHGKAPSDRLIRQRAQRICDRLRH